jgi:thiol-disulfide isomerase/thioredoxin
MKKAFYIFLILVSCLGFFFVPSALAAGPYLNKVEIVFFWGDGCPHCAAAEAFLSRLQAENSSITVKSFEVWNNQDNLLLLQRIGQYLKANIGGVPFTVVGDRYFSGFLSSETTGQQIEQAVELCQVRGCTSVLDTLEVAASETTTPESDVVSTTEAENKLAGEKVTLPLVGEINLGQTPLFLLTTIIGFLDGFNPCAMWVLLLLISLLLGMENKRRRWLLGSAFIFVSGRFTFYFLPPG